jgi:hypothetical protein
MLYIQFHLDEIIIFYLSSLLTDHIIKNAYYKVVAHLVIDSQCSGLSQLVGGLLCVCSRASWNSKSLACRAAPLLAC